MRDLKLADIYRNSDLFRQLRNGASLSGKCGMCEFRDICGGSRARAYAVTGDPLAQDPSCVYQSKMTGGANSGKFAQVVPSNK